MESAPLPKVDKRRVTWWRSRLEQYRNLVVPIWNALTFHQSSFLPGAAVWLGINLTVVVVFRMSHSFIQTAGELLLIVALLYLLLQLIPKISQVELFPKWDPEHEDRFQHVCIHMAHAEQLVSKLLSAAMEVRKSKPWKFYCVGLVTSLLLIELGRWLSSALFVQLIVCFVMTLPPMLEYGLLSKESQKQMKLLWTEIYSSLRNTRQQR